MIGLPAIRKFKNYRAAFCIILIFLMLSSGINVFNVSAEDELITLRCAIKPIMTTNPLNADQNDWRVLNLIYEGATKNSPTTGERLPYIAVGSASNVNNTYYVSWTDCVVGNFTYCPKETWEDPAKPEIIMFYDFDGVYWHDGAQMSIRDIMFTFHVNADEQFSWLGHPLADLAGRSAGNYTDDHWLFIQKIWESQDNSRAALKFTLQKPYYSVFDYYLSAPILPYHIWGTVAGNQLMNNTKIWSDYNYEKSDEFSWKAYFAVKFDNAWPIGSGPFRWDGSRYSSITLVPWEKHFYKPGFKYYSNQNRILEQTQIDRLLLNTYDSEERAVMDLESNRLDYIAWGLPQETLVDFANDPDISLIPLRATSVNYMGYNMRKKSFGYDDAIVSQSIVEIDYGKSLRLALSHCIDTSSVELLSNMYAANMNSLSAFGNWENESAPSLSFDSSEAITILRETNYILEDSEKPPGEDNWWYNPDGSFIGSAIDGKVRVLAIGAEYDILEYKIGTMIVSQMNLIGINSELIELSPEELVVQVDQRNFDIFLGSEDMTGIFKDRIENYAYTRFHSYNSYDGPNYFGYRNSSLDDTIFSAMSETNHETRKELVNDIMASLAYDQPSSIIYSKSNTEIYRLDNFYGLKDDGSGSLLNTQSMTSVRMQEVNSLKAKFIGLPLTIESNLTVKLKVRVVNQRGYVMAGVYVNLEASEGSLLNITGITDVYGVFTTNYTAPNVPHIEAFNNWELVTLKIKSATLVDYRDAPELSSILTIVPDQLRHLSIRTKVTQNVFEDIDSMGNSGFTYLEIIVLDSLNIPVGNALISIETFGGNLTLKDTEFRVNQDGRITIKIFASNIDNITECMIRVNASTARFINASHEFNITIIPRPAEPIEVKESMFSQIAGTLIISIVLVSSIGALIYVQRKKKINKK